MFKKYIFLTVCLAINYAVAMEDDKKKTSWPKWIADASYINIGPSKTRMTKILIQDSTTVGDIKKIIEGNSVYVLFDLTIRVLSKGWLYNSKPELDDDHQKIKDIMTQFNTDRFSAKYVMSAPKSYKARMPLVQYTLDKSN